MGGMIDTMHLWFGLRVTLILPSVLTWSGKLGAPDIPRGQDTVLTGQVKGEEARVPEAFGHMCPRGWEMSSCEHPEVCTSGKALGVWWSRACWDIPLKLKDK